MTSKFTIATATFGIGSPCGSTSASLARSKHQSKLLTHPHYHPHLTAHSLAYKDRKFEAAVVVGELLSPAYPCTS